MNKIKDINWVLLLMFILSSTLIIFLLIKFTILTIIGFLLFLFFIIIEMKKVRLFKGGD